MEGPFCTAAAYASSRMRGSGRDPRPPNEKFEHPARRREQAVGRSPAPPGTGLCCRLPQTLASAGCHPRIPISMSVPGTAADVSTSYYDSISTVPGTGPRLRFDRLISSRPSPNRAPRGCPVLTLCGLYHCNDSSPVDRTTSYPARPMNGPSPPPGGWAATFNV